MDPVEVTRAALEDAAAVLHLQREAYESEARLYNDWNSPPLTQTLEQLLAEFSSGLVLKATVGPALVGSVRARAEGGVVHIGRLIVAPAVQRQGIGGRLLRAVELAFPEAKCFELFTGSLSDGNIHLYRRNGYAVTHEEVLSPKVTFVFMRKINGSAA